MKKYALVLVPVFATLFLAASPALADVLSFTGASDTTVEATSQSGAAVNFTVTAADASSTPFAVTCSPLSGSTFALGTTSVSCTAVDGTGATSTTSFAVGVVDRMPPSITAPANQSFATSTFPARPTLTPATASDLVDPHPSIYVSTSTFTHGTTTVMWTATDAFGNSATTSSQVGVFLSVAGTTSVPATCTVFDTTGTAYDFPATSSPSAYLGICALKAAKDAGVISDYQMSNFPGIGLFVASIAGLAADPTSQYWALYQNDAFANCGLGCLLVAAGDTIQFQLHDFSDYDLGDRVTLHIDTLIATSTATSSPPSPSAPSSSGGGGGGGGGSFHQTLNIPAALAYLASAQHANGSFDSDLLTDWVAIAFAASDASAAKTKLKNYLLTSSPALSSATDYERHAMALQALGIDPYTGTPVDTIAPIIAAFDGNQIGSASQVNDDIFAVFPLMHAGYSASDAIIQNTIAFIVSQQKSNGSWGDADTTAAAIQALGNASSLPGVSAALTKAEQYLRTQQQQSGGFLGASGINSFSTSWALQAIAALNQSVSNWAPMGYTPQDYLAGLQQRDGGVDATTASDAMRIWATSYAIPAALNKTWDSLLTSFPKPTTNSTGATGSASLATSTAQTATTTLATALATTTLATTTPPLNELITPISPAINATTTAPALPAKPKPPTVSPTKKQATSAVVTTKVSPSLEMPAKLSLQTNPPTQTAAVASTQDTQNVFVNIWNFFKHLFGL